MTTYKEFDAKTTDAAVERACKELNLPKEAVRYDVISHGSTGIFGLVGVKKARIRVVVPEPKNPEEPVSADKPLEQPEGKPASQRGDRRMGKARSKPAAKTADKSPDKEPVNAPDDNAKGQPDDAGQAHEKPVESAPEKPAKRSGGKSRVEEPGKKSRSRSRRPKAKQAQAPASAPAETGDMAFEEPFEEQEVTDQDLESATEETEEALASFEPDPETEAAAAKAREVLENIAKEILPEVTVGARVDAPGQITLSVDGQDTAILIGRRGQTMDAIQYIMEKIVNKGRKEKLRLRLDVGGYLSRREENLRRMAQKLGEKVRRSGKPASLSPLSAYERRIVHLALKDDSSVRTLSKGTGYLRRLIILPQKGNRERPSQS